MYSQYPLSLSRTKSCAKSSHYTCCYICPCPERLPAKMCEWFCASAPVALLTTGVPPPLQAAYTVEVKTPCKYEHSMMQVGAQYYAFRVQQYANRSTEFRIQGVALRTSHHSRPCHHNDTGNSSSDTVRSQSVV